MELGISLGQEPVYLSPDKKKILIICFVDMKDELLIFDLSDHNQVGEKV